MPVSRVYVIRRRWGGYRGIRGRAIAAYRSSTVPPGQFGVYPDAFNSPGSEVVIGCLP